MSPGLQVQPGELGWQAVRVQEASPSWGLRSLQPHGTLSANLPGSIWFLDNRAQKGPERTVLGENTRYNSSFILKLRVGERDPIASLPGQMAIVNLVRGLHRIPGLCPFLNHKQWWAGGGGESVLEIVVTEGRGLHQSVAFSCVVLPPTGRRHCCLCLSNFQPQDMEPASGESESQQPLAGTLSRCEGVDWMCRPFRRGCPTSQPVHAP